MRNDMTYLLDMLLAARHIGEFTAGMDRAQFMASLLHQNAVIRLIQVIGEAARLVSQETKNAQPEIPWHQISGMRNHVIHRYFDVNLDYVWDVVERDAPELVALLAPLVPKEDSFDAENEEGE